MTYLRPNWLLLSGVTLLLAGFLFDVYFAGIPYQDPTEAQQAAWIANKVKAEIIMLTGLALMFVGLAWRIMRLLRRL